MIKYTSSGFTTIVGCTVINAKKKIKGCCQKHAESCKKEGDKVCPDCGNEMHVAWRI